MANTRKFYTLHLSSAEREWNTHAEIKRTIAGLAMTSWAKLGPSS